MTRWTIIVVLVLGLGAGCRGGSHSARVTPTGELASSGTQPASSTPTTQPSSPTEALALSSQRLQGVTAGRAAFDWHVEGADFDIRGNGELVIVAPAGLHLTEYYRGRGEMLNEENSSELLVLDPMRAYVKTSPVGKDWVVFTPQELGADWDILQRLIAARSPFDYAHVVGTLAGQVEDLGQEQMDGAVYRHLRGTVDAGTVMNALADAYGSQGQIMLANRFAGPVTLDIWIDPATVLPYTVKATGTPDLGGETTDLQVSIVYHDLNAALALPSPPADAVPMSELGN